jgi:hypothetical protein
MEKFAEWVINNKEWLFSGVGVVIGGFIMRLIFKKTNASTTQTINSGNNSNNIQVGRNARMRK